MCGGRSWVCPPWSYFSLILPFESVQPHVAVVVDIVPSIDSVLAQNGEVVLHTRRDLIVGQQVLVPQIGTPRTTFALQQFRPVTALLSPSGRARPHACS